MIIKSILLAAVVAFALPVAANASSHATADNRSTMPSCAASDPVVWVNTKSKVYHARGDAYFGKTASGVYACTSKAISMGAHLSGAKGAGKPSGAAVDAPNDDATAAPLHAKHKKKHAALPTSEGQ